MTKEQALDIVAAKLAYNSWDHKRIVCETPLPHMKQHLKEVLDKNLEVAKTLGIEDTYKANLSILNV